MHTFVEADPRRWAPTRVLSRATAARLMGAYLVVVAVIVFWPTGDVASGSVRGIWSVLQVLGAPAWVTPRDVEFVTNVLLFMPLSFLGHTFRPRWRWQGWFVAGLTCTVLIELSQALFLPGRSPAVFDVVANTLGAVLGYFVVRVVSSRGSAAPGLRAPSGSSTPRGRGCA
jgi:glycopeptide antibiotics resistance protein